MGKFFSMNKHKNLVGASMLVLGAFIWGTTFVAQSDAMSEMGPFMFQTLRSVIGAVFLTVLYLVTQRGKAAEPFKRENLRFTISSGVICGILLCISVSLQQVGLIAASPGKAAFITALYIIIVPFLGIFLGKKIGPVIWGCAAVAIVGFYLLNITEDVGFGLSIWDIAVLGCAVCFSFHIMALDRFAPKMNSILLSCIQFWTVTVLSAVCIPIDTIAFNYSLPSASVFGEVWFNIVYAGLFSSGIAYTLQIAGQKRMNATTATLIMSLESVFAAVSSWIYSPENALSPVQICGCVLIFVGICVAQIPFENKKKLKSEA